MNRIERAIHRQIGDQPLDLPPAREMDIVAAHAILLGARRRGEAGLLAMIAAQRLGNVVRGAVGKHRCWQFPDVPGRLPGASSLLPPPPAALLGSPAPRARLSQPASA